MTLYLELDQETEKYLVEILAKEKTTSQELVKRLLAQHWHTLQPRKTIVERRGGHPEHLLQDAPSDLSSRETRKKMVAEHIEKRHAKTQKRSSESPDSPTVSDPNETQKPQTSDSEIPEKQ